MPKFEQKKRPGNRRDDSVFRKTAPKGRAEDYIKRRRAAAEKAARGPRADPYAEARAAFEAKQRAERERAAAAAVERELEDAAKAAAAKARAIAKSKHMRKTARGQVDFRGRIADIVKTLEQEK